MATVTGYTAAAMAAIRDKGITNAVVDGNGDLIITHFDATTTNAGSVVGPTGPSFAGGAENEVLAKNSATDADYKWLDVVALAQKTPLPTTDVSTTTYTVLATDAGKQLEYTNAAAGTITIDTQANQSIPAGLVIPVFCASAGGLTIALAGGVTDVGAPQRSIDQGEAISLRRKASDDWYIIGGTSA